MPIDWDADLIPQLERLASVIDKEQDKYWNRVKSKFVKDLKKDFSSKQRAIIERMFRESVTKFYNAYSPSVYTRQGHPDDGSGGLYELLSINMGGNDMIAMSLPGYDELYDASQMHSGRNGYDGLFDKVFMQGWHGGAESISDEKAGIYGRHPSPGTPYYRTPPGSYARWGRRAKQSQSAYDIMREKIDSAYLPGGKFQTMAQRTAEELFNKGKNGEGSTYNDGFDMIANKALQEFLKA